MDGLDSVATKMASRGELSCSLVQGSTVRRLTVPFQTALKGERVKIGQPFPRRLKPSRQLQPERSVSSSTGTVFSALTSQDTDRLTRLPLTMLNFQQGKTNQMAHTCLKQRTNQTNTISSNNRSNQCAGILHSVHMINPHQAPSHSEPQPDGTLAPFSYLSISGSGGCSGLPVSMCKCQSARDLHMASRGRAREQTSQPRLLMKTRLRTSHPTI